MRLNWNVCWTFVLFFMLCGSLTAQQKRLLFLDADTGNEVDDLYAITRALVEPSWSVSCLHAAHWQTSHWAIAETMENSHRLNQVLIGFSEKDIPTCRGGSARMYDWGDLAQHSAATSHLIASVRDLPDDQKLEVVVLGALTNVASAIYLEPNISQQLRIYWLGTQYDRASGTLKLLDFNSMMDIRAVHQVLESQAELHVMPNRVSKNMRFTYAETATQLQSLHPWADYLVDRWFHHLDGGRKSRVLWDLALVEAMIHPEWAKKERVVTSKNFGERPIYFYSDIDVEKMKADFFHTFREYLRSLE